MKVRTKVKSGNIVDSARAAVKKATGVAKKGQQQILNVLTWPW